MHLRHSSTDASANVMAISKFCILGISHDGKICIDTAGTYEYLLTY